MIKKLGRAKGRTHPVSPGAGGQKKSPTTPKSPIIHHGTGRPQTAKHVGKTSHATKKAGQSRQRNKSKVIESKQNIEPQSAYALDFVSDRGAEVSKILRKKSETIQSSVKKRIYADSDPSIAPPPPIITVISSQSPKKSDASAASHVSSIASETTTPSTHPLIQPPQQAITPGSLPTSPLTSLPSSPSSSPTPVAPCSSKLAKSLESCGFFIGQQLSSGSFSHVFRGKYKNQKAAVKVVDLAHSAEEFRTKFFPRELYALRMLEHPNIINTFDVLAAEGRIFIFMELAERGDILDYIRHFGTIEEWMAKIWFKQMLNAIRYMHSNGFAHRDLKSENILLDAKLNTKLTDFGFSRVCFDFDAGSPIYSETYCGSSAYVAPEVLKGEPYNAMLSDVWSLGVVLYVMLNNALPFDDSNLSRMMKRQMRRKYTFSKAVKLTDDAIRIVKGMLEPDLLKRMHLESVSKEEWLKDALAVIPESKRMETV